MEHLKFVGGRVVGLQRDWRGHQVAIQRNIYALSGGHEIVRYQYERDGYLMVGRPRIDTPLVDLSRER
jgi:hypothetical protein